MILKADNGRLIIKSDDGQAKINCLAGSDFPFQYSLISKIKTNFLLSLPGADLRNGLLKTVFSSAKDNSRPELAGILFWLKAKDLILAGTDSYRLAENLLRINKAGSEEVKMIMPAVSGLGLARILTDELTQVFYSDNQILFEFADHIFTARLTEGNYPDYKQIMPTNLASELVVVKQELALAVKRAGIFVGAMSNAIKLNFDDQSQKITIRSEGGNLGSSDSVIKAVSFKGPSQGVAYNFQYLLEGINNIAGDKVVLATSGPDKPTVLKGLTDDRFTYLVMPVRV